jgi:hypothetical protein
MAGKNRNGRILRFNWMTRRKTYQECHDVNAYLKGSMLSCACIAWPSQARTVKRIVDSINGRNLCSVYQHCLSAEVKQRTAVVKMEEGVDNERSA